MSTNTLPKHKTHFMQGFPYEAWQFGYESHLSGDHFVIEYTRPLSDYMKLIIHVKQTAAGKVLSSTVELVICDRHEQLHHINSLMAIAQLIRILTGKSYKNGN